MAEMNHELTRKFERIVADYTQATYVVAVNSCTMALFLSMSWVKIRDEAWYLITIPKRTYVSVPQVIQQAGHRVAFEDSDWSGGYQLSPVNVWDYARRFTYGMYRPGQIQCVSFHATKILGVKNEQGGAILLDDPQAYEYFKRARLDGRTEGVLATEDKFIRGWHCYMSPRVAQLLSERLNVLPAINRDLPNDAYADLSLQEIFK